MLRFWGSVAVTVSLLCLCGASQAQANCAATDYNADGVTDQADADIFKAALGSQEGDLDFVIQADHDGDGEVTTIDFSVLFQCLQS